MDDSDTETDVFCLLLTTHFLRFGGTPQAKRPVLSARMCPTGPYLASGGLGMAHFGLERFRQTNHVLSAIRVQAQSFFCLTKNNFPPRGKGFHTGLHLIPMAPNMELLGPRKNSDQATAGRDDLNGTPSCG